MDERRYVEEEVKEIFEKAAKAVNSKGQSLTSGEGLTLAQLQEIGREVGLAPDKVAEAALAIDRQAEVSPRRTHFGMPISVSRTVDLPRALTDLEWERLVGMLRQTFGARGRVESHGSLRHWNNGNLHASIEPTENGHRLRLGTLKGNAVAMNTMGLAGIGMGSIVFLVLMLVGGVTKDLAVPLMMWLMGGAAIASSAITLPSWAREREAQMEYIANQTVLLVGSPAPVDQAD